MTVTMTHKYHPSISSSVLSIVDRLDYLLNILWWKRSYLFYREK
uniref:Uncharacterized protein n=1 Tax=Arundo donax TaxID=35708 RepID=A0A0A8ZQD0_ARUDO